MLHARRSWVPIRRVGIAALACVAAAAGCATPPAPGGDAIRAIADGIPTPLDGLTGDAARGLTLVRARDPANCVLCHALPGAPLAGDLGPPLAGVGARLSVAQLRLRIVDERRAMPHTIMPSYHIVDGLNDVAPQYRGRPILDAQQVEDVVAYLATLR